MFRPTVIRDRSKFQFWPALKDSQGRIVRGPFCTHSIKRARLYSRLAASCNHHDSRSAIRWPSYQEAFPDGYAEPHTPMVTIPEPALRDILLLLHRASQQIAADHSDHLPPIHGLIARGISLLRDCIPRRMVSVG